MSDNAQRWPNDVARGETNGHSTTVAGWDFNQRPGLERQWRRGKERSIIRQTKEQPEHGAMNHQPKYRVTKANGDPLPEGEPFFVLRGQDALAPSVLAFYIHKLEEAGTRLPQDERPAEAWRLLARADSAREHLTEFEEWPNKKLPD